MSVRILFFIVYSIALILIGIEIQESIQQAHIANELHSVSGF